MGWIWADLGKFGQKSDLLHTYTDVRLDGFAPNSNPNPSPSWLPMQITKNLPHRPNRPHLRRNPGKIALSGYYAIWGVMWT